VVGDRVVDVLAEKCFGPTIHIHIHFGQEVQVLERDMVILMPFNPVPGDVNPWGVF